jgi:hypothetical protein
VTEQNLKEHTLKQAFIPPLALKLFQLLQVVVKNVVPCQNNFINQPETEAEHLETLK